MSMGSPHVLVVPYPVQGHVIPMMELSQYLVVNGGFRVTFVNTDFNHERVMNALPEEYKAGNRISLVSIPDGLEPWEDRNNVGKLFQASMEVIPGKLEELIKTINRSDGGDNVTCVIADVTFGGALEVAEKMGIRRAAFSPASAWMLALVFSIHELMNDGIINENGTPIEDRMIKLSPTMPPMSTNHFFWACIGDSDTQKIAFDVVVKCTKAMKVADWVICNSTYELEHEAFTLFSNILPIGPLLASNRLGRSTGYFWPEDSTCLKWLDQQPPCSVIYVAFGSFTVFDQTQFRELALGLELTNRPFLWVVRPDITEGINDAYPEGFQDRISLRGKTVGWAPQQQVLSHPSIACFLSHCGWNSTMEGVSNGIPFLCWPYFADQFLNQSYICDVWKVGLGFDQDESGIITRGEIKNKVEQLLSDQTFKARSLDNKENVMRSVNDGRSCKNLNNFFEWLKEQKLCYERELDSVSA